jgi:hypothetical protein
MGHQSGPSIKEVSEVLFGLGYILIMFEHHAVSEFNQYVLIGQVNGSDHACCFIPNIGYLDVNSHLALVDCPIKDIEGCIAIIKRKGRGVHGSDHPAVS